MPPSVPMQNTNQFQPTPALGMTDMGIVRGGGALAMQISANEAGPLYAGSRVKLDTAITSPMPFPQVVACGDSDKAAIGVIALTAKNSSFVTGSIVEVMCQLGPITQQVAAATIAPGAIVEMASGFVQTKAGGAAFGIALDPGVLNGFIRIAGIMPLQVQA